MVLIKVLAVGDLLGSSGAGVIMIKKIEKKRKPTSGHSVGRRGRPVNWEWTVF